MEEVAHRGSMLAELLKCKLLQREPYSSLLHLKESFSRETIAQRENPHQSKGELVRVKLANAVQQPQERESLFLSAVQCP